jgi:hypothetical protein
MWMTTTWVEYIFSCVLVSFLVLLYHANRYLLYMIEDKMTASTVSTKSTRSSRSKDPTSDAVSRNSGQRGGRPYQPIGVDPANDDCCGKDELSALYQSSASSSSSSQDGRSANIANDDLTISEGMYFTLRICHALLSGCNYGLSLLLMMVAMTFNSGLFVALVVGYIVGDLIFYVKIKELTYEECH